MDRMITVTKFLPRVGPDWGANPVGFLRDLRKLMLEARQEYPELEDFELADLGFTRCKGGLKINLYFSPLNKQELSDLCQS
ncbi:MAG TPA: hypothetical protein VHS59_04925 [Bacillota bacterium]|nr:hypothetical protein [Bacillota bacterium]